MTDKLETERPRDKFFSSDKYVFQNIWVDLISYSLISTVILGSVYIYHSIEDILSNVKHANTNYTFPTYYQLLPSMLYLILMIVGHEVFVLMLSDKMQRFLHPRYSDKENNLVPIFKKKIITNIYKFCFYLFSSIYGYYVLKQLDFFPWSLLGKGEYKNLFNSQYPSIFYFEKPDNFDFYYNFNLSFALFDGYLLLSNPIQSDFLFMALHHLSTYSLIVFSFVTNYSHIGCIVYYIHYLGDVFSYIVRVSIHLNISDFFPFVSTFVFLVVFSYTRLFVFGDVVYQTFYGIKYTWTLIEYNLYGFLWILMFLNILWIVLITKKFIKYCMTGDIEEIYKFKTKKHN